MPIYEAAGSKILHFGHGDISIGFGKALDRDSATEDELVFTLQPPHPIGADNPELTGRNSQEAGSAVRMIFDRVESLDVLIEQAQLLKEKMLKGEQN